MVLDTYSKTARGVSMYKFKHILVGLNLNESDAGLINYAGRIARTARSEDALFVYIIDHHEIPEAVLKSYPDLAKPVSDTILESLQNEIKGVFSDGMPFQIRYDLREGQRLQSILEEIRENSIDLVIIGRKKSHERSSMILAERLARKAPCTVLVVPEGSGAELNSILVATDFSHHSLLAMEEAIQAALALGISEITCANVYHVPVGYGSTGRSYEEFAEIMLENAKIEYGDFIEKCDLKGIRVTPVFELNDDITKGVLSIVNKHSPGLLVVGARGRRGAASLFLGSITEHILDNVDIPVMAVKNKDEGMKLIDAIFSI